MRKIEGLRFLQIFFPHICVDCVFVTKDEPLDVSLLEKHAHQIFRIRSGRLFGSEIGSPQKTCYTATEVKSFIDEAWVQNNNLEFVIHRVTDSFFNPLFVGSIALYEGRDPLMVIDFQAVSKTLIADMDNGVRPRDWKTVVTFSYPCLKGSPTIDLVNPAFEAEATKHLLYQLWLLGREISSLKENFGQNYETVTRFNIYPTGAILLDDHRSIASFMGRVKRREIF